MCMNLMGPGEIKQRINANLSRQRIYQLTQHPSFPKPLAELAMGDVWDGDDVEEWIREHRPAPAAHSVGAGSSSSNDGPAGIGVTR